MTKGDDRDEKVGRAGVDRGETDEEAVQAVHSFEATAEKANDGFNVVRPLLFKNSQKTSPQGKTSLKADEDDTYLAYDPDKKLSSSERKMNVVECNIEMHKCARHKDIKQAKQWFELMKSESEGPDVVAYATLMNGHCKVGNNRRVFELFEELASAGVEQNGYVFNILIDACSITADVDKAELLFSTMERRDGIQPNLRTFSNLLKVCTRAGDLQKAKKVHKEMRERGFSGNTVTFSTLIDAYAEATDEDNGERHLRECKHLLTIMRREDIPANCKTYTSLIKVCVRAARMEEAFKVLDEMDENGVPHALHTYSLLFDGCAKSADLSTGEILKNVDRLQRQMQRQKLITNAATYTALFNVCLRVSSLRRAQQYHKEIKQMRVKLDVKAYSALIRCYEKLGNPWNKEAYLNPCFQIVKEVQNRGFSLGASGYTSLISACGNAKDIQSAIVFWEEMKKDGVQRNLETFGAMIKAHASVNDIDEAFALLEEMEIASLRPSIHAFSNLLSSCERTEELSKAHDLYQRMLAYDIQPTDSIRSQLSRMNLL